MPESKNRPGHPYKKPSDIPAKQRTKGRTLWAIIMGIFGLLIAFFANHQSFVVPLIGAVIGTIAGYFIGRNMEKEVAGK